jgi:hypothetical protein
MALPPSLSINDVSVNEGSSGTTNAVFTVKLSGTSPGRISVNYATANNTAIAGLDYTRVSGTLTFNPGETTKTLAVPILSDSLLEPNETFRST